MHSKNGAAVALAKSNCEITQRSASRSCCTIGSPRSNVPQTPPSLLNNVLMAFGATRGFPALSQIRKPVLVVWTTSLGPTAIFSSDGATMEPVVVMPSLAVIPSKVTIGALGRLGDGPFALIAESGDDIYFNSGCAAR